MHIHLLSAVQLKAEKPGFVCCCEAEAPYEVISDMMYAAPVDKNHQLFPEYKAVTIHYDGLGEYHMDADLTITKINNNVLLLNTPYGEALFKTERIGRYKYLPYVGKEEHEDFKYELLSMSIWDDGVLDKLYKKEGRILLGASGVH